jgi:hypothetical protein
MALVPSKVQGMIGGQGVDEANSYMYIKGFMGYISPFTYQRELCDTIFSLSSEVKMVS